MSRPIRSEILAPDSAALASLDQVGFGWTIIRWDGPVDDWLVAIGDDAEFDARV